MSWSGALSAVELCACCATATAGIAAQAKPASELAKRDNGWGLIRKITSPRPTTSALSASNEARLIFTTAERRAGCHAVVNNKGDVADAREKSGSAIQDWQSHCRDRASPDYARRVGGCSL